MKQLYRFIVRHRFWTSVVLSMLLCGATTCFGAILQFPVWHIVRMDLILLFLCILCPLLCGNKLMTDAVKKLHNTCDPYPLLQETEFLLQHAKPGIMQQAYQINHCFALDTLGEFQKALEGLTSINIDRYMLMTAIDKYVYYNNLAELYKNLGMTDLGDLWMQKAIQFYTDTKNFWIKRQYTRVFLMNEAERCCKNGEHAKALEILKGIQPIHKLQSIQLALRYGEIAIALGDTESAKAQYAFVIRNGNKLRHVDEARKALIELQKD